MSAIGQIPALAAAIALQSAGLTAADIMAIPADLVVPATSEGQPAAGKRVRQVHRDYRATRVHHLLYLPADWKKGGRYPVIVEYAGNHSGASPGTVEGSNLGYGISAGKGVIWVCMPFVERSKEQNATQWWNTTQWWNATQWWGDTAATVDYCKKTVAQICRDYGGDASNVFIAGFSRGAIACNYIGLHDDEIASLWRGFICHSHYEGVRQWPGSTPEGAAGRLQRLQRRPQFISHEKSVAATKAYLNKACPTGRFTFVELPFDNHTDAWVLRDIPQRKTLRQWFRNSLAR